ncbi:MAG: hypothetical protein NW203_04260 [Hyphomonadaceae bacterium]|nr:hypothetical protein [Hyphomonadaceae bacterium]
MIETKLKLWRNASVAVLAGLSLTACAPGGEGGEGGEAGGERGNAHGEAGESGEAGAAPAAPGGEGGEAAIGESGGEHGEAGVQTAYAGIDGPARTALRLQHLKAFALVAQQVAAAGQPGEASVLVAQGLLEVYDPAADQFGGFDPAAARDAGATADPAKLAAAIAAIDAAQAQVQAQTNPADIAARMADMAAGLYAHVVTPIGVDPIEYQHSYGMALAARDALVRGEAALKRQNAARYAEALAEIDRFIALWPGAAAPQTPATHRAVVAQASRVRLALSAYL